MCGQVGRKKRKSEDLGWGCQEHRSSCKFRGEDELSAGHLEFEILQGHPTCQVVGYLSRKIRDNGTNTEGRQLKSCHHSEQQTKDRVLEIPVS